MYSRGHALQITQHFAYRHESSPRRPIQNWILSLGHYPHPLSAKGAFLPRCVQLHDPCSKVDGEPHQGSSGGGHV
eukprot:4522370-Karenia_brevis.AAC.1